jgi:hypothetical protein
MARHKIWLGQRRLPDTLFFAISYQPLTPCTGIPMKMVIVIYRHSLDNDLLHFLKSIDIKSFTESPTVSGIADAGHAFGTGRDIRP